MSAERVLATYLIETPHPLQHAAEVMAGEQSTGTFIKVPGETEELKQRHAARIESLTELDVVDQPSLPHARAPRGEARPRYRRARVVLSFPIENMGPSLPNLVATVMGNLYELREFSGLKLVDLELPASFGRAYQGPQFAVAGTRTLAGVEGRPIIGTIVKPSVGLSPAATAEMVGQLCEAGLDFIKDDELQANGPHSPLATRVAAVMPVINRHADRTGKKVMFAFNITGDIEEMLRGHDTVLAAGGTCVMLSLNSVGLPAAAFVRKHCHLPIHGHRNGWGALTRSPLLGMDFLAYSKLWRTVGIDHLHCNGLRNKFWEPDDSVMRSAKSCGTPMPGMPGGFTVMPVLSSAQWAGQAPDTYERLGTTDLMYVCGGGIIGHPSGIAAGVASVRQGWEAAAAGKRLEDHARDHRELREAMEKFGKA